MDIIPKDKLINKAGDLKVLPFVARKLLDSIGSATISIDELSNIVEKDQTISARILKISNSSFYGLRQEVASINQAILILGMKTIRSLVLSVSTRSIYKRFGITEQKIWEHSVGSAIAAKMIAEGLGSELEETAFTGGLMHDIGKVIMNNETPDAFAEVMMKTYNEGLDSLTAEEEVYGYSHPDIGARVAKKWGLSKVLVEVMEKHHLDNYRLEDIGEPFIANSVACVNLADNACKLLGIGYRSPDDTVMLHELPSAVFLNISKERLDSLVEEINETYNNEKSAFQ
jgi:putative nucleotidyltransferase with HDIG domain